MKKTDWKKTINKLQKQGFTQTQLSEASGLTQGTISYLKSGRQIAVLYDSGAALLGLLK